MLVCSEARLMVERRWLANGLHALLLELEGGRWNLARVEAREVELGLLRHNLIPHLDILFLILVTQLKSAILIAIKIVLQYTILFWNLLFLLFATMRTVLLL